MNPKIIIPQHCENSPRKKFLVAFNRAFATGNHDFIAHAFSENLTWNMIGNTIIKGKAAAMEMLEQMNGVLQKMEIKTVITHGSVAAVDGTMKMDNCKTYAFCDTYRFVSAGKNVIKELNSYIIETSPSE